MWLAARRRSVLTDLRNLKSPENASKDKVMGEGSKRGADCGVSQLLVLFRAPQGRRENIEWKLSAKPNLPVPQSRSHQGPRKRANRKKTSDGADEGDMLPPSRKGWDGTVVRSKALSGGRNDFRAHDCHWTR